MRTQVRNVAARTMEGPYVAVDEAVKAATGERARNHFPGSGYRSLRRDRVSFQLRELKGSCQEAQGQKELIAGCTVVYTIFGRWTSRRAPASRRAPVQVAQPRRSSRAPEVVSREISL